jgi:putative membrane protein
VSDPKDGAPPPPFIQLPSPGQDDNTEEAPTVLDHKSPRLSREDEPTERAWADHIEDHQTERAPLPESDEPIEQVEQWKSLHSASLVVNLIPRAWRTLRSAWPLFLALLIGSGSLGMRAADLLILLLFAGLSGWNTFVHWLTLRYRMHGDRLEIKSGLINRQSRTIDPSRIQNIELVENLFHKFAGLVELRIETAGGTSTEGLLSALSLTEAQALRARLAGVGSLAQEDEAAPEAEPILEMSLAEILAYGLSRRTIGTVAVLTAVGLEIMGQLDPAGAQDLARFAGPGMIAAAFMVAFAGSWVLSAGASFFTHYGFRLIRTGESIQTISGLTTKRRVEIPLAKVQLVRADEPLLRRLMGYGTIAIETAGLGVQNGQVSQAEGLVPMVDRDNLGSIVSVAAPRITTNPWTAQLKPAHPRALWRAVTASTIQALLIAIPAFFFLDVMGWVALALIPLSVVNAWFDWNWQGWLVTDQAIISRHGFLNRQTYVLARDKLQSVHMVQGPLMRLHGLGRVVVRVAGSQVALPDISKEDAARVMATLTA